MKNTCKFVTFCFFCTVILSACFHQDFRGESVAEFDSQKVTIAGSTTILPISEAWASASGAQSNLIVSVQGGGSTSGINLVKKGEVDIGASSRELNLSEKYGLQVIEIAHDALAIIVHPDNPVSNITVEQLRAIFSGEITNWAELGGTNKSIQVINRESGSGTRSTFEDLIMCQEIQIKPETRENLPEKKATKQCAQMMLNSIVFNSNSEVKRSIHVSPNSIGYISWAFLDQNVKALNLNTVAPTYQNINNSTYPLYRNLYYLVKDNVFSTGVDQYLEFVLSPEGQALLLNEGFLPINN